MSSICGLFWRDGRAVEADQLSQMVDRLAHWQPDAKGSWHEGAIGLGNCTLWSTPESKREVLPLRDPVAGLVITADARLDNREDLIRELGVVETADTTFGDVELIGRAYLKWGLVCVDHLIGDFAFALWDAPARRLFCARDPMGMKPFFYHVDERRFLFGSEIKAIFAHPDVSRELNPLQIGAALAGLPSFDDQTAFKAVRTLEPASALCFEAQGWRVWKYWRLEPDREIRLARDDDYVDAFQEILQRAIDARLRSTGRVGCLLSGGLDATTCLSMAMRGGKIPLDQLSAFSWALREGDDWWIPDERPYIEAFLRAQPLEHQYVYCDSSHVFDLPPEVQRHQNGPESRVDYCQMIPTLAEARRRGVRVLLNGMGGDQTASYVARDWILAHLFRGDWAALKRGVEVRADASGAAEWREWKNLGRSLVKPERFWAPLNYQWTYRRHWERVADLSARGIPLAQAKADQTGLVKFVKRALKPRIRGAWRKPLRADQIYLLTQTHVLSDQVAAWSYAASFGIECRSPLLDRRVIEFAVAMPPRQHVYGGSGRRLLRRVASRFIPEKIALRPAKSSTMPDLTRGLVQSEATLRTQIKEWRTDPRITSFIDLDRMEENLRRVVETTAARSREWAPALPFCRGFLLGQYLASNAAEGREP